MTKTVYYSLDEEARVRGIELASLPPRHCYALIQGEQGASTVLFRTADMPRPGSFMTRFAGVDFLEDFLDIVRPPKIDTAPSESLFVRLRRRRGR